MTFTKDAVTDNQRLDWLESHVNTKFEYCPPIPLRKTPYWRKVFGMKDATNRFDTLRDAIDADMAGKIR
jgi:hypothetical protein